MRQHWQGLGKAGVQLSAVYGRSEEQQDLLLSGGVLPMVVRGVLGDVVRQGGVCSAGRVWDLMVVVARGGWGKVVRGVGGIGGEGVVRAEGATGAGGAGVGGVGGEGEGPVVATAGEGTGIEGAGAAAAAAEVGEHGTSEDDGGDDMEVDVDRQQGGEDGGEGAEAGTAAAGDNCGGGGDAAAAGGGSGSGSGGDVTAAADPAGGGTAADPATDGGGGDATATTVDAAAGGGGENDPGYGVGVGFGPEVVLLNVTEEGRQKLRLARMCGLVENQWRLLQLLLPLLKAPATGGNVAAAAAALSLGAAAGGNGFGSGEEGQQHQQQQQQQAVGLLGYPWPLSAEAVAGLQLAVAIQKMLLQLWEGPLQQGVVLAGLGAEEEGVRRGVELGEFDLVQWHVWRCLGGEGGVGYGLGEGRGRSSGGGAGGVEGQQQQQEEEEEKEGQQQPELGVEEKQLSELLMADWVSSLMRHPALRFEELTPLAARVFHAQGVNPVTDGGAPPAREVNPLGPDFPQVGISGGPLESARVGRVGLGGGGGSALPVPRCGSTFLLCPMTPKQLWFCGLCQRRYRFVAVQGGAGGLKGVPRCVVCGVRLGGRAQGGAAGSGWGQVCGPVVLPGLPMGSSGRGVLAGGAEAGAEA